MIRPAGVLIAALLVATPALALESRSFPRATAPHAPTLGTALAPLIAGSVHIRHQSGQVFIEASSWTGVNLASVQAAVDAAQADTPPARAKAALDATQGRAACLIEAMARALVPVLNQARQTPSTTFAAITAAAVRASLKTEIDALGCGD